MRASPAFLALLLGCSGSSEPTPAPAAPGAAPAAAPTVAGMPAVASSRPATVHPWVVLGVDGLDPRVVSDLAAKGQLPSFARLCQEGVCAKTSSGWSVAPASWTTIATGVEPERHGVDRVVTETPEGRLPIASTDRRAAAIWDVASAQGYKTALLGWWASWPAYDLNGVYLSDRAHKDPALKDRVRPLSLQETFDAEQAAATAGKTAFERCEWVDAGDAWVAYWTPKVVAQGYDLVMAEMRCVDTVSHRYWAYWDTAAFPNLAPADLAANKDVLPKNYAATDAAIGAIVAAMAPDTNLLVLSDIGFAPVTNPKMDLKLNTDRVLAQIGYATVDEHGAAVPAQSRLIAWHTAPTWYRQKVRFQVKDRDQGGTVAYADLEALKNELKEKLAAITFTSGKRVFELVEPEPREAGAGADAVIRVLKGSPTMDLLVGGATVQGLIDEIQMNTGEHETSAPPGFFLAWGPDIDKGFATEAVRVQDVAPTLAFGLGLPVADDAAGQPITALFNRSFQKDNGKKSVASWGVHGGGAAVAGGAGAPGSTP